MIEKIWLDMDGVMVDFLGGLHRALNAPYSYDAYPYEKGVWDMLGAIKPFNFGGKPPTFEQCNDCCTRDFWANLHWTHDGRKILGLVTETFGRDKIQILTTCMPNPGSYMGKLDWLDKHIPDLWNDASVLGPLGSKSAFASPDALLIDDRDKNVEEFRAAGGEAILIARPWNKLHMISDRTFENLKYSISSLKLTGAI